LALNYADENFPLPVVEELRRRGHDVLTTAEAGQGVADEAVLAFAHTRGRAVLTHNRKHFRSLHDAGHPHSGLVLCTEDMNFVAPGTRIDAAIGVAGDLTGQLIRINRPRV
jgi:hypothetical protein